MKFIALKPCRFAEKDFRIGDTIPDGLVHNEAVTRLIKSGIIAEVGATGILLPGATSIVEPEATIKPERPSYTEKALLKMKRSDLAKIAEEYGMVVDEDITKQMMADFILESE